MTTNTKKNLINLVFVLLWFISAAIILSYTWYFVSTLLECDKIIKDSLVIAAKHRATIADARLNFEQRRVEGISVYAKNRGLALAEALKYCSVCWWEDFGLGIASGAIFPLLVYEGLLSAGVARLGLIYFGAVGFVDNIRLKNSINKLHSSTQYSDDVDSKLKVLEHQFQSAQTQYFKRIDDIAAAQTKLDALSVSDWWNTVAYPFLSKWAVFFSTPMPGMIIVGLIIFMAYVFVTGYGTKRW